MKGMGPPSMNWCLSSRGFTDRLIVSREGVSGETPRSDSRCNSNGGGDTEHQHKRVCSKKKNKEGFPYSAYGAEPLAPAGLLVFNDCLAPLLAA